VILLQVDSAAGSLGSAALQQLHSAPLDSVRVKSFLPTGVAQVVRFLLTTVPQWVQIAGAILAVIVGFAILWLIVRNRRRIAQWFVARPGPIKLTIVTIAIVVIAGATVAGAATWNYTQHANEFCFGCHVMDPAYEKMAGGDTKHSKLSCHSCHQQSVFASMRQVYVWVAERPQEIGSHANVPNRVCEACHVTQDTATWQRIASTAGHRVHLESDSTSLRNVTCVKCHGAELHRFEPAKQTCGQSGCHEPSETRITLAKMSGQTVRHCTSCHSFTADVPALATKDSARTTLVPGSSQCLGCHDMQKVLPDFKVAKDPHAGKCGMCHNPHEQKTPMGAVASCTTSGCHADWRDEPFHVGAAHRNVGSKCLTCHVPHAAKVDASECQQCHERVRSGGRLSPPLPFDTAKALKRTENVEPRGIRVAFAGIAPSTVALHDLRLLFEPPAPQFHPGTGPPRDAGGVPDSFPHSRHEKLACLVCHQTGSGHGLLTFERPRGCMICHHQAPAQSRCTSCHQTAELSQAKMASAVVTVPGHAPKPRPVEFFHAVHADRKCVDCHTTPVSLAPGPLKATCRDCHEDHHSVGRTCSTCHAAAAPKTAHHSLETSHQRCDACHTATTVARLTPTRTFCNTCHTEKAKDHYPQKECTTCHFLTDPAAFRAKLVSPR
jgi:nitrate/TMAO reductase-like tetraheme cytochrome c subunit